MNEHDEPIAGQEQQSGLERHLTKDIDIVNLNTATVEELSRLPGIKTKLAGRIVEYRAKVHPFRETAEITQVRGISAALYAGIADLLTVGPAEPEEPAPAAEPEAPALPSEPEAPPPLAEAGEPALPVEPEGLEVEAPAEAARPPEAGGTGGPASMTRGLPPAPPSRPRPAPEPKRGAGWPALLAIGLVSAIGGACLALLLLFALNGTLKFGPSAAVSELETRAKQLDGQAGELMADLSQAQGRLDEIDRRLTAAQAELDAVKQEMTRMGGDAQAVQGRLGAIETQFGGLTEDLQAVRQAAGRFNSFLSGLRELLDQAQGPALGVTPLPQTPNPTHRPGMTVVPQPTSTPRP